MKMPRWLLQLLMLWLFHLLFLHKCLDLQLRLISYVQSECHACCSAAIRRSDPPVLTGYRWWVGSLFKLQSHSHSAKSSRKRTEAACSRSSSSCGDFPQYKTLWLLSWLLSTLSLSCCVFEILLVVLRKTTRIFSRSIKEVTVKYPLSPASNVLCLWVAGRGFYLHKLWWEADKQSVYRVSGVLHDARSLFPASGGLLLCRRATRWCRRTGMPSTTHL